MSRTQADREFDWATGRELERKDSEISRLTSERDAALEQARRDREYCAAQTGENVRLANQVMAVAAERDKWRAAWEDLQNCLDDQPIVGGVTHQQSGTGK